MLDVTSKYSSYPPVIHKTRPGDNNAGVICMYVLHKVKFQWFFSSYNEQIVIVAATLVE